MDQTEVPGSGHGTRAQSGTREPSLRVRGLLHAGALLILVSAVLLGLAGCTGHQSSAGSNTGSSGELSRCGVCSGSGQTKDHNRGVMEVCRYCNGRGLS